MTPEKMIRATCLWFLCTLAAAADSSSTVNGRVVNKLNSSPLPGITVTLAALSNQNGGPQKRASVLTATDGSFSFRNVPNGQYALLPESNGSTSTVFVSVETSRDIFPVVLEMEPNAVLQGAVRDENSLPVPDVNLLLVRRMINQGRASMNQIAGAQTNDLGEYRFANVLPGRYLLCWSARASTYQIHKRLAYPAGCFPGAVDMEQAQWLDLSAGKSSAVDFTIAPVAAGWISGTVEGADAGSIGIQVIDRKFGGQQISPPFQIRTDSKTSSFQIRGVPAGKYRITGWLNGGGTSTRLPTLDFESSGGNMAGLRWPIGPLPAFTGSLRFTGDPPPADTINIYLTGAEWHQATPSPDYTFASPDIPPGNYDINVNLPQPWYVKSIMQAGKDLLETGLQVEPGSPLAPVEIEIAQGSGTLECTPTDNSSGEVVVLRRGSIRMREIRQGAFGGSPAGPPQPITLVNIPPGEYDVYAWKTAENIEYANPEVLKKYEALRRTVTIQDGTTTKITLAIQTK